VRRFDRLCGGGREVRRRHRQAVSIEHLRNLTRRELRAPCFARPGDRASGSWRVDVEARDRADRPVTQCAVARQAGHCCGRRFRKAVDRNTFALQPFDPFGAALLSHEDGQHRLGTVGGFGNGAGNLVGIDHDGRHEDRDDSVDPFVVLDQLECLAIPRRIGGRDHVDRIRRRCFRWKHLGKRSPSLSRKLRQTHPGADQRVGAENSGPTSIGHDRYSITLRDGLVGKRLSQREQLFHRSDAQHAALLEQRLGGHVECHDRPRV
jgi:hypothetical protein